MEAVAFPIIIPAAARDNVGPPRDNVEPHTRQRRAERVVMSATVRKILSWRSWLA